jgi:hypothetical protein
MSPDLSVSGMRFEPAGTTDVATGLIGWCSFLLNDRVRVDGVALRRTMDKKLTLSWPSRIDGNGRRHPYLRPIDDASRRDLEQQVLSAPGLRGGAP